VTPLFTPIAATTAAIAAECRKVLYTTHTNGAPPYSHG
jgi:hypothetical protein